MPSARSGVPAISKLLALNVVFACFSAGTPSAFSWDTQGAARAFEEARQMDAELANARGSRAEFLHCARTYRLVYMKDPHYRHSGDAIYAEGKIYQEMGDRFGDLTFYETAARRFAFLVSDYGGHRYCSDALVRLGNLYSGPLTNQNAANESYQRLKTQYHSSQAALKRVRGSTLKQQPLASTEQTTLQSIRHWSTDEYTRIAIDLDRETKYHEGVLSDPDRLYFDISNTRLSADMRNKIFVVGDEFLKGVRVAQNRPGVVRVVLDLTDEGEYSVTALHNPFRIVVDIRSESAGKSAVASTAESSAADQQPSASAVLRSGNSGASSGKPAGSTIAAKPAAPTSRGHRTLTRTLGLKVRRIVIDPGHGGYDTGSIGPGGLHEKDLVLSIAKLLCGLLEQELGAEVILTRDDDSFVSLEERTAIANQYQADLFLSIHANSGSMSSTSGVETYYLDFAGSAYDSDVAARENALSAKKEHNLEDLIREIALADKSVESRELAVMVQNKLYSGARQLFPSAKNRGVRKAPFVVLIGANMPSVLTEIAFLSNPEDEALLGKEKSQLQLARALFSGIEGYMSTLASSTVQGEAGLD